MWWQIDIPFPTWKAEGRKTIAYKILIVSILHYLFWSVSTNDNTSCTRSYSILNAEWGIAVLTENRTAIRTPNRKIYWTQRSNVREEFCYNKLLPFNIYMILHLQLQLNMTLYHTVIYNHITIIKLVIYTLIFWCKLFYNVWNIIRNRILYYYTSK